MANVQVNTKLTSPNVAAHWQGHQKDKSVDQTT